MKIIKSIVVLIVVGFLAAFTLKTVDTRYEIGDTIEDFSLLNTDNSMVSLSRLKSNGLRKPLSSRKPLKKFLQTIQMLF